MFKLSSRIPALLAAFSVCLASGATAQQNPFFVPGNLVVVVEGCGVHGGTCTAVHNGTGTGTGNSSAGGYGDNQAAPLTLFQYIPNNGASATYVNSLVLPQTASGANLPVSGEYGSSSEGTVQLSGTGQYLTLMGYGIDVTSFNNAYYPVPGFTTDPYGAAPSGALAQSGSLTGQSYTPVPRVITLIDAYGNVNSSTPIYNVFNTNNPRSIYTADGVSSAYISGQGSGCDATGGVFYTRLRAPNTAPTAITGIDAAASSSCPASLAQDARNVQIYNGSLYVSVDSTEGKSFNRAFIGTLGKPPATGLYTPPSAFPYATGPTMLTGFGNTGGTGKQAITSGVNSTGNAFNAGLQINLSPESFFFASPSVLYVTDTGNGKQSSANSTAGDGGLQKWINSKADGSGTWTLAYTLYKGLNLVQNPATNASNTSGATGLYGLAGTVVNGTVYLYVTNYNISDLDPTFLYGIADTLTTTTNPGTTFNLLDTAPKDSNFKGVSFTPSLPAGSATITSSPSGLAFTTAGTGCVPGSYTTPTTLVWTSGSSCTLSVTSPQPGATGTQYTLAQWQDGNTGTSDTVVAPATSSVYNATFNTQYQLTASATTGGTVEGGGFYTAGTNATVTATPSTGYYFVNFTGATTSTTNPLSIAVNAPSSVTANFAAQTAPTVTFTGAPASAPQNTTFTVASSTNSGATPTYAAAGACTISGTTVTVTAATGACMLTATWSANGQYLGATATQTTTATAPVPGVTLSPTSLTFAALLTGNTSAAQTVTLTNSGFAALTISTITAAGDFAQTNTCGTTVAAGASCTISVTFTPNGTGSRTGAVTVTDNAAGSPQTVSLTGTGQAVTLISSSSVLTIPTPGGTAVTSVGITPSGGFTGVVNLSCAIAPVNGGTVSNLPTCSLSPTQVTLSGSTTATTTLQVNTTANTAQLNEHTFPFRSGGVLVAGLFAFVFLPKRRWRKGALLAVLLTAGLTVVVGCSDSHVPSGGTTAGNYRITITGATASTGSTTVTVPLTVQ